MIVMLDVTSVAAVLRGGTPTSRRKLERASVGSVAVSSVTQAELLYGAMRRSAQLTVAARVNDFLRRVRVLAWDAAAGAEYATVRVECDARSAAFHPFDLMAFAHAASLARDASSLRPEVLFVTGLKGLPKVRGLKVEDWIKEG